MCPFQLSWAHHRWSIAIQSFYAILRLLSQNDGTRLTFQDAPSLELNYSEKIDLLVGNTIAIIAKELVREVVQISAVQPLPSSSSPAIPYESYCDGIDNQFPKAAGGRDRRWNVTSLANF